MKEVDGVLALIGGIYDASLDRDLWSQMLERICSYVGGRTGSPEAQEKVRKFVDLHFSWGIADDYLDRYTNNDLVNDQMRRRFEAIMPHVRRALLIGKVIDLPRIEAAAFADLLDGINAGLFLVDASGSIIHANASGHALVRECSCLFAHGGRLRAADHGAHYSLQSIFAAAARGDASIGEKAIAVPLKSGDGERYVAHVLPLTAGARRKAGRPYAAVAAVFARKAELDLLSPSDAVAQDFGLTAAELRVLFAIVDIGGVPEVAPVLGISETTVKTHLQSLFSKTATNRQADLVKLVAGYSSTLVG